MTLTDPLASAPARARFQGPARVVLRPLLIAWIGASTVGCNQEAMTAASADPAPARGPREVEVESADLAGTDRPDRTPVSRLIVNGDAIVVEDILRPIRSELSEAAKSLPPERYQRMLRDRIIQEFRRQVRSLLLYQQAAKRLSEREEEFIRGFVDDEVRKRINTEYGGRQSRYEQGLAEQGLTLTEDRERIRRDLIVVRHLQLHVRNRVLDPTRAELVRYFEAQRDELSKPERRRMSLIELPASAADARQRIDELRAKLENGADFAELATAHSKGIHADEGGAWDWLGRAGIREHWEPAVEALFALEEGEISAVVETDAAFFIIRCDGIEAAVDPDFEAMQPRLITAYRELQFNHLVEERVGALQEQAVFVPDNIGRFLLAVAAAAPDSDGPGLGGAGAARPLMP